MALNVYQLANTLPKKFKNKVINEKWHLVYGYSILYEKLVGATVDFTLSNFLNVDEEKRNDKQKANLIILTLLHLLVDGNHPVFFEHLGKVESYIQNR